jgi:hypothetical protein
MCIESTTPNNSQSISRSFQLLAVAGNAAIGLSEIMTGAGTALATTIDGIHNVGDSATYYMQTENLLNPDITLRRRELMRRASYWIIAAGSLGASVKAGIDLGGNQENMPDPAAIYSAGASLALNGLMFARLRSGIKHRRQKKTEQTTVPTDTHDQHKEHVHTHHEHEHSHHEHDLTKHFLAVDIPSAFLALTGSFLQRYCVDVGQFAALASGLFGAYVFRPTTKNLSHHH